MSDQTTNPADQRHHALIRQRILGIRAANPSMSIREIAGRAGVSIAYAEEALGEKSAPAFVS